MATIRHPGPEILILIFGKLTTFEQDCRLNGNGDECEFPSFDGCTVIMSVLVS